MIGIHHVLSSIILNTGIVNLKKQSSDLNLTYTNNILLISSLAPDFDFIFEILKLSYLGHKTLTHSFSFLFIICLFLCIFFKLFFKKNYLIYLLFFVIGYSFHLFLDYIVWGWIYLYWFSDNYNFSLKNDLRSNWYIINPFIVLISFLILISILLLKKEKNLTYLFFVSLAVLADFTYFWIY